MKKKTFIGQLKDELDGIRKELGCTEAEAYFTLSRITRQLDPYVYRYSLFSPPSDEEYREMLKEVIASTKELMTILEACREAAQQGNWSRCFAAVFFCQRNAFPLPAWVDDKLYKVLYDYEHSWVKSLDDAFGAKRPKHYRQAKEWEDSELYFNVYNRCRQLQDEGVKIGRTKDGGLFNVVGKEFVMSAGKVRKIYYKIDKFVSESRGELSASQLVEQSKEVK